MIRIGIVEDDQASIDMLLSHLDRFQREHAERFHIGAFSDGRDVLHEYRPDWDILLLDIQMEHVDGMTAARRIREVDKEVLILFVTASPHYAISGYEVDALSYLLKPVKYALFEQELLRCLSRLRLRERRHMLFTDADGAHRRIDVADIVFIESARHRVVIHTLDDTHIVVTTLKALEAELSSDHFFRSNSGFLLNLRHVTGVEAASCLLRGGLRVPVSRARKQPLLKSLAGYIGGAGATA